MRKSNQEIATEIRIELDRHFNKIMERHNGHNTEDLRRDFEAIVKMVLDKYNPDIQLKDYTRSYEL